MKTYLVSYDLYKSGQNYTDLISRIQQYSNEKALLSAWLIKTTQSHEEVYNYLTEVMDGNDLLFINDAAPGHGTLLPGAMEFINS